MSAGMFSGVLGFWASCEPGVSLEVEPGKIEKGPGPDSQEEITNFWIAHTFFWSSIIDKVVRFSIESSTSLPVCLSGSLCSAILLSSLLLPGAE